jgi:hypothetical protein
MGDLEVDVAAMAALADGVRRAAARFGSPLPGVDGAALGSAVVEAAAGEASSVVTRMADWVTASAGELAGFVEDSGATVLAADVTLARAA